jgi:hypothetical protein
MPNAASAYDGKTENTQDAATLAFAFAMAEIYREKCGPWGPAMAERFQRYWSKSNGAAKDHVWRVKMQTLETTRIDAGWCAKFSPMMK